MSPIAPVVLVVEDQLLIAKQIEFILSAAGYRLVGPARTFEDACRLALQKKPDIALVDLNLADGATGIDAGRFIAAACTTQVVYMTANLRQLQMNMAEPMAVVEKPFTSNGLLTAVAAFVK